MNCPGCAAVMRSLTLEGKLGFPIGVDLCTACRVIWFGHLKELQLAPRATLDLFEIIAHPGGEVRALPLRLECPTCRSRLLLTHDVQRNTKFDYWRCDNEHGHLISFVDFLREKDFIRPLSPTELVALRRTVRTVNCGHCGGPIDLGKDSVCAHCGAPLSVLDPDQMTKAVQQLQQAASGHHPDVTTAAEGKSPSDAAVHQIMKMMDSGDAPKGLMEAGLRFLGDLVKKSAADDESKKL